MSKYKFSILAFFSLSLFFVCLASIRQVKDTSPKMTTNVQSVIEVTDLGFPFRFRGEGKYSYLNEWRGNVYLDKKYFSEENISSIFQWYTRKHPQKKEILVLEIVDNIDLLNLKVLFPGREAQGLAGMNEYSEAFCITHKRNSYFPDNEVCFLTLKREGRTKKKTIVLRGRSVIHSKLYDDYRLEEWNSDRSVKIKCWSFIDDNVEPRGTYYSFENYNKESKDWESLITVRYDKGRRLPFANVNYVNDQIVYMHLGWMFVVTVDGGKTWLKWDAESSLPNWKCCDPDLITSVSIAEDGKGTMKLKNFTTDPSLPPHELRTKNFGATWVSN